MFTVKWSNFYRITKAYIIVFVYLIPALSHSLSHSAAGGDFGLHLTPNQNVKITDSID